MVIRVVQSENILLHFLRSGHDDDGCSCNHRAVPPSVKCSYMRKILINKSPLKYMEFLFTGAEVFLRNVLVQFG